MNIEALPTHLFLQPEVEDQFERLGQATAAEYFFDNRRLRERIKLYDPGLYSDIRLVRHEILQPLTHIVGIGQMLAKGNRVKLQALESFSKRIISLSDIFYFDTPLAFQLFSHNPDRGMRRPETVKLVRELTEKKGLPPRDALQLQAYLASMGRRELAGWIISVIVENVVAIGNFDSPLNRDFCPSDVPSFLKTEIPSLKVNIAKVVDVFPFLQAELTGQIYQRRDGDEPLDFWRIVEESTDQFNWKVDLVSGWDKVTDYVRKLRFTSDPGLLRIILENLFRNAYRYSDKYIHVTFRLFNATGNRKLIITVENDGPAIPHEEQVAVFEKGRRGSNTSTKEGSGFGLYLVKKATEVLGGETCLISGPTIHGPRTQVKVTLPIEDK